MGWLSKLGGVFGILESSMGLATDIYNITANERNFQLQKEQFEYEKQLQKRIFDREDTAIQRRMADLKEAGINPLLAVAGEGAGAGTPIATAAPQRAMIESSHFDLSSILENVGIGLQLQKQAIENKVGDEVLSQESIKTRLLQYQLDEAETFSSLLSAKKEDVRSDYEYRIKKRESDLKSAAIDTDLKKYDLKTQKESAIYRTVTRLQDMALKGYQVDIAKFEKQMKSDLLQMEKEAHKYKYTDKVEYERRMDEYKMKKENVEMFMRLFAEVFKGAGAAFGGAK